MQTNIDFTKIKNDINGNPRYVCHFFALTTDKEQSYHYKNAKDHMKTLYNIAIKRANKIGGKKYDTKLFPKSLVFQAYSAQEIQKLISEIIN